MIHKIHAAPEPDPQTLGDWAISKRRFWRPPPPSNHRSCITALPLSSGRMGDHGATRCSDGMSIEQSHALVGGSFPYSQGSSETTGRERADLQCREATKHHVADRTHLRNTECNTGGIPPFHKTWLIRPQPYPTAYRPSITDCRSPSLRETPAASASPPDQADIMMATKRVPSARV